VCLLYIFGGQISILEVDSKESSGIYLSRRQRATFSMDTRNNRTFSVAINKITTSPKLRECNDWRVKKPGNLHRHSKSSAMTRRGIIRGGRINPALLVHAGFRLTSPLNFPKARLV
jgi:hypothetical protein